MDEPEDQDARTDPIEFIPVMEEAGLRLACYQAVCIPELTHAQRMTCARDLYAWVMDEPSAPEESANIEEQCTSTLPH